MGPLMKLAMNIEYTLEKGESIIIITDQPNNNNKYYKSRRYAASRKEYRCNKMQTCSQHILKLQIILFLAIFFASDI